MDIYVYGDVTCRGFVSPKKAQITLDELLEGVKIFSEGDDDAIDEFFDKVDFDRAGMISTFIEEGNVEENIKKLTSGEAVTAMGEEQLYGYALTKEDAMVAYAKANSHDDGEW